MAQSIESLGPNNDAAILGSIIDSSIAGFTNKNIALFQNFCSHEIFHVFIIDYGYDAEPERTETSFLVSGIIVLDKDSNSQSDGAESPKPTAEKVKEYQTNCLVPPKVMPVLPNPPSSICLHCLFEVLRASFIGAFVALGLVRNRPGPWVVNLSPIPPIYIVPGMNVEIIREHIIKTEQLRDRYEIIIQSGHYVGFKWFENRRNQLNQEIVELRQIYELELRDSLQRERLRLDRREFERQNRAIRLKKIVKTIINPSKWTK